MCLQGNCIEIFISLALGDNIFFLHLIILKGWVKEFCISCTFMLFYIYRIQMRLHRFLEIASWFSLHLILVLNWIYEVFEDYLSLNRCIGWRIVWILITLKLFCNVNIYYENFSCNLFLIHSNFVKIWIKRSFELVFNLSISIFFKILQFFSKNKKLPILDLF